MSISPLNGFRGSCPLVLVPWGGHRMQGLLAAGGVGWDAVHFVQQHLRLRLGKWESGKDERRLVKVVWNTFFSRYWKFMKITDEVIFFRGFFSTTNQMIFTPSDNFICTRAVGTSWQVFFLGLGHVSSLFYPHFFGSSSLWLPGRSTETHPC